MSDTCGGSCCALFYQSRTPEEWEALIESGDANDEQAFVAAMLIPLTDAGARYRSNHFGDGTMDKRHPDADLGDGHWYTCTHWDEDTRLCGVYEQRPAMCSDYPYDHDQCDLSASCSYTADEGVQQRWRAIRCKQRGEIQPLNDSRHGEWRVQDDASTWGQALLAGWNGGHWVVSA